MRNRNLKVIVCGEGGIGKTTFLNAFKAGKYKENSGMTVGFEPHIFQFERADKERINLQIWDLSGQDQFADIQGLYKRFCHAASCAIVCFDMGEIDSLEQISKWLDFLPEKVPKILVGTKEDTARDIRDLVDSVLVSSGIIDDFENYVEISAKENIMSISKIFTKLLVQTCNLDEQESQQIIGKHIQKIGLERIARDFRSTETELEPIKHEFSLSKEKTKSIEEELSSSYYLDRF